MDQFKVQVMRKFMSWTVTLWICALLL